MSESEWTLKEVVIAIHQILAKKHGSPIGIRSEGLLESALNAPRQRYHYLNPKPKLWDLAASYGYSLAHNHPFFDGNKRICLAVCELFLIQNFTSFHTPDVSSMKTTPKS